MFERLFGRTTRVSEPFFRMTLPGRWTRTFYDAEDRWNFNTDSEQITVSLVALTPGLDDAARQGVLEEMVLLRRQAELSVAAGVNLGEVVHGAFGPVLLARYEASGPEDDRLSTCLVMMNSSVLGTFFYEAIGLSQDEFQARGRAAFNSIQLAETRA